MCVIILCLSYSFLVYLLSKHIVRFEKSGPRKRWKRTENRSCNFNLVLPFDKIPMRPPRATNHTRNLVCIFYNQHRERPRTHRTRLRSVLGKLSSVRPLNGINEGLWSVPLSRVCTQITRGMWDSYKEDREKLPSNFCWP